MVDMSRAIEFCYVGGVGWSRKSFDSQMAIDFLTPSVMSPTETEILKNGNPSQFLKYKENLVIEK
jgi:hypothetical protein